jgi:guanylate kinase
VGPPLVIVLSSVSAGGKDAVRSLLMAWDLPFHFAVTATTRPPRADEVEGVHYHFLSDEAFDRLIAEEGFIEHAIVYGNKYGVPRAEIERQMAVGIDVVTRVDVQGAATLKRLYGKRAVLIFIAPPSLEEAGRWMEKRADDDPATVRMRLDTAPSEMEAARDFDHLVVNETDRLEETARRVVEIIAEEKSRQA